MFLKRVAVILVAGAIVSALAGASAIASDVSADSRIAKGRMSAGLNYPGIGVRYFFIDSYAGELRCQFEKDILVMGMRACRYFRRISEVLPYAGLEADFVNFKGSHSKGTGLAVAVLAGGEYFVWEEKTSVQLDCGTAYLALADNDYDLNVSGIEFVVNFGVNYYF